MTVIKSAENLLLLDGACPSDEAELLLRYLTENPQATVDLRGCEAAHTAVVQVLLAAKPKVLGPPARDTPLRHWVYPALIAI
jgi:hypothetical protein